MYTSPHAIFNLFFLFVFSFVPFFSFSFSVSRLIWPLARLGSAFLAGVFFRAPWVARFSCDLSDVWEIVGRGMRCNLLVSC